MTTQTANTETTVEASQEQARMLACLTRRQIAHIDVGGYSKGHWMRAFVEGMRETLKVEGCPARFDAAWTE